MTTLAIVVVILLAIRLSLPAIIRSLVNRKLASIPGYHGQIGAISLGLVRGAVRVKGVGILKQGPRQLSFSCHQVEAVIAWRPLLRKVVTIKSLVIEGGTAHYVDTESVPRIDLALSAIRARAFGLTTDPQAGREEPGTADVRAFVFGDGTLHLHLTADRLDKDASVRVRAFVDDVPLALLNPFIEHYGRLRASGGALSVVADVSAEGGRYSGYVTPRIEGLAFAPSGGGLMSRLRAKAAAAGAWLVSSRSHVIATTIPVQGSFGAPSVDAWYAFAHLLKNAYSSPRPSTGEGAVAGGLPDRHRHGLSSPALPS